MVQVMIRPVATGSIQSAITVCLARLMGISSLAPPPCPWRVLVALLRKLRLREGQSVVHDHCMSFQGLL